MSIYGEGLNKNIDYQRKRGKKAKKRKKKMKKGEKGVKWKYGN